MKYQKIIYLFIGFVILISSAIFAAGIYDSDKYAWGDEIGWVNFKADNGNVDVLNDKITGYIWNDNYGWINMAPDSAGVLNDGAGNLSGYAWGENLGWIDFTGVTVNTTTGQFSGIATTEHNGNITFDGDNISVRSYWMRNNEDHCQEHSLHGFAWSDDIGWISFDCKSANSKIDYGVDVDRNGNLSGFAWSDSIGWIDFEYYGDDDRAKYNSSTFELENKAKALSGLTEDDDNWTGTIVLNGTTDSGDDFHPVYSPATFEFDEFAWGDSIIGWIDFKTDYSVVTMDPFYFRLYSDHGTPDDPVPAGGSVVISWVTAGAMSCTGTKGEGTTWTNNNPKPAGEPNRASETISNLSEDVIISLTCTDSSGTDLTKEIAISVAPPAPKLFVDVDDDNIPSNTSTNINYTIKDVKECRLTSSTGRDEPLNSSDGAHSVDSGNLTEASNWFTVTCKAQDDIYYPNPIESTVYVDVERLTLEFYPMTNPIRYKDRIKLFWRTEFATDCSTSGDLDDFNTYFQTASYGESIEEWTRSTKEEVEGVRYGVTMTCTGTQGQTEEKQLKLKVGGNPVFGEI